MLNIQHSMFNDQVKKYEALKWNWNKYPGVRYSV